MLPRTLSTFSLLVLLSLVHGELDIISERDLLRSFLIKQDRLLCALIKYTETNDTLEDNVIAVSQNPKFKRNIAGVIHAPYNDQETNISLVEHKQLSDKSSILQCFIDNGLSTDISSPQSAAQISRWLISLKKEVKQMWKYDINQLETIRSKKDIVILALPTQAQMFSIDIIGTKVTETLMKSFSVALVLIHPNSKNARLLRAHLNLPLLSSVLAVFSNINRKERDALIFKERDIVAERIFAETFTHLSGIKHLNATNFQWETMTVKRSERFRPYIVVFYAWWAEHVESYLKLIKASVEEMQRLSVRARFAWVNVGQEKKVISRYVDVKYFKRIPFIAIFQREKGKDTVNQTVVHLSHPSLFYLSKAFRDHGVWLYDAWDKLWDYVPYLSLDYTHYSDVREGPKGYLCTAWSSNLTDDTISEVRTQTKTKSRIKSMPTVEKQMARVNGVPILTGALWDAVMEKSQVIFGTFKREEDVQITVLAFIRDGCGSCNKKMQTFQEVHKELRKKENTRVYMVNCSGEPSLCENLSVLGFPTVSAFRSFAALATTKCSVHPPEKPYIRRDYHGPISTGDLIPWIESLAVNGLSFVGFRDIGNSLDMKEDVRLVATIIPKFSNYLPLAPGGERSYFYSPHCFRVACERLFGLATCYIANSKEIPHAEFTKAHAGKSVMVVTEITFERKDGVSLTLMRLGKSMQKLIAKETFSDLDLFHNAHQYSLQPKQTCEEDHDSCTQTIVSFVRDHIRLPVTHLTSEIFHTKNNPIFEVNKPVLVALSHGENLMQTSSFMQLLVYVAKRLYHNVTVTVLDVDQFPSWAGNFVPHHYSRLFMDSPDGGPLHIYPRICLVTWTDHKHAAFYPPLHSVFNKTILVQLKLTETKAEPPQSAENFEETEKLEADADDVLPYKMDVNSMLSWDEDRIVSYVEAYLKNPDEYLVQTEHF